MKAVFTAPEPVKPGAVTVKQILFSGIESLIKSVNFKTNASVYSYDAPSGAVTETRNQLLSSSGANSD